MNGRTILGAAAGTLVAALGVLALLQPGAEAARVASATIEVDDPPAEILVLPEGMTEVTKAPALEPRANSRPTVRAFGPRGALASALTLVPSAPLDVVEPTPPLLADTGGSSGIEVPKLEAIRLPAPEGPGSGRTGLDACRGPGATFAV